MKEKNKKAASDKKQSNSHQIRGITINLTLNDLPTRYVKSEEYIRSAMGLFRAEAAILEKLYTSSEVADLLAALLDKQQEE